MLVCALDWGLGHATRCIPVIRELQRQGAEVIIASSGKAGVILQEEFPLLLYIELPGYNPKYSNTVPLALAMVTQVSGFQQTIKKEHALLEEAIRSHKLDLIISDNRYGCYSNAVPSVLISHQLRLRLNGIWSIFDPFVNRMLQSWISHFSEVWVPDQVGSGLTERFMSPNIPITYVGWLSRFGSIEVREKKYDVMMIVSGPEPLRTSFERILREQAKDLSLSMILVTGKPGDKMNVQENSLRIVNHLSSDEMAATISSASVIIARGGYTTIMDLIALGKRAVFVPTPQQPEQQWMASQLHKRGVVFSVDQDKFDLRTALQGAGSTAGLGSFKKQDGLLESAVAKLM